MLKYYEIARGVGSKSVIYLWGIAWVRLGFRQLISTNANRQKDRMSQGKVWLHKKLGFHSINPLILCFFLFTGWWFWIFTVIKFTQEFYKHAANRKSAWDVSFLIAWGDSEYNLTSMSGQSPLCWYLRLSCYCIPIFFFIPEGGKQRDDKHILLSSVLTWLRALWPYDFPPAKPNCLQMKSHFFN